MNGIPDEQADIDLFLNYIFFGSAVFDIARQAQEWATDANLDGIPGSIADFVFMTRFYNGADLVLSSLDAHRDIWSEATATWREWRVILEYYDQQALTPIDTALISSSENRLTANADRPLGGIYAIFSMVDSTESYQVENNSGLKMQYGRLGSKVRVLLFPGVDSLTGPLPAGQNDLFRIKGDLELKEMQASDYDGNMLYVIVDWKGKKLEFPEKQEK